MALRSGNGLALWVPAFVLLVVGCSTRGMVVPGTEGSETDASSPSEDWEQPFDRDERPGMPPSLGDTPVVFGAAGDFGGRDEYAGTVMTDMVSRNLAAFFLLGDMSYSEIEPEQAWCDWVHAYLGDDYPMQVVAGNHEEDRKVDGYILDFAECMPDRLNSTLGPGGYSVNYVSDLGPVSVISTSPDLQIDGVDYTYADGTAEQQWLLDAISTAKAQGDWVVVGMHKNCVTIGNKTCEIGPDFAQMLVDQGVDLVLQGHDHDYQRTHSMNTIEVNDVGQIGDAGDDASYGRGAGTVFVIVGTAGRGVTHCSHSDSEYGNFATHWCGEEASDTKGYLVLTASQAQLTGEYVSTTGTAYSDTFVIE